MRNEKKWFGTLIVLSAAVMLGVITLPSCLGGGGGGSDGDSDSDSDSDADMDGDTDSEAVDTFVEGEFEMSVSPDTFSFLGDFGLGGANYYGYCMYSVGTDRFEFEIGTDSPENITSATDLYIKFTGIVGPPVEGVYSDQVAQIPKDDEALYTLFDTAIIANGGNEFTFSQPDDATTCYVELFAAAAAGELTSIAENEFEYYIALHCTSLDDVTSGATQLTAFNGNFFFDGCE